MGESARLVLRQEAPASHPAMTLVDSRQSATADTFKQRNRCSNCSFCSRSISGNVFMGFDMVFCSANCRKEGVEMLDATAGTARASNDRSAKRTARDGGVLATFRVTGGW